MIPPPLNPPLFPHPPLSRPPFVPRFVTLLPPRSNHVARPPPGRLPDPAPPLTPLRAPTPAQGGSPHFSFVRTHHGRLEALRARRHDGAAPRQIGRAHV